MMLLNKPKDKDQAKPANETTEQSGQDNTLSQQQIDYLPKLIRKIGVRDTTGGQEKFLYKNELLDLTVVDGKLSGTFNADSMQLDVDSVFAGHYPLAMSVADQDKAKASMHKEMLDLSKLEKFAPAVKESKATEEVRLQNNVLAIEFNNHGGYMSRATLLDPKYKTYFASDSNKNVIDSAQVQVFNPDDYSSDNGGRYNTFVYLNLDYNKNDVYTSQFYFTPKQVNDSVVEMTIDLGDGARWGYRYTLPQGDSYVVRMDIIQENVQNIIPETITQMKLNWAMDMPRLERGLTFEERYSGIYYRNVGEGPDNFNGTATERKELNQSVQWVAFKNQFFSTVMIPRKGFISGSINQTAFKVNASSKHIKRLAATMELPYNPSSEIAATIDIFIGPNLYPLLKDMDSQVTTQDGDGLSLTRVIPLGWSWLRWINTLIVIPVFTFLSGFVSNYGIIILLLTIFIKIIIFPFTYKSYLSQAKMRLLAPEIKEINDKYPGKENAMVRQQKTMALYSKAGASPFSGCLPLLLQMPILIAMFSFFPSCIELRGQSFLWVQDLASPDVICTLPFSIPFYGNQVSLFCLLMTATNIIYTRINMKNQPSSSSMPGMKWMMYLMPLMFLFFFNSYPAALSYYYFLSLLITIIQTWVFRRCVNEEKLRRKMAENATKPKKKSGFMARLEEAQRKQQAALREQQKRSGRR